ncbi:hypothetical protein FQN50_007165 [Emmonsiellopsis sp. PD_5]|nr:hypothetical protein FQN50_007165 [Emmonsiellopsis sp. PD_5]
MQALQGPVPFVTQRACRFLEAYFLGDFFFVCFETFIVAALGIRSSLHHLDYAGPTSVPARDHNFNAFYPDKNRSPSLSHLRSFESRSFQERGKARPCSVSRKRSLGGDQELMSQRPHASEFLSGGPLHQDPKALGTTASSTQERNEDGASTREPQHARESATGTLAGGAATPEPSVWRTPGSAERGGLPLPPRSIGVHSILNPSHGFAMESSSRQSSRDGQELLPSTSPSPLSHPQTTPSPMGTSSQPDRPISQLERTMWSPRSQHRRILTPRSPAVRAASLGARFAPVPGTMHVEQTPFLPLQQPYTESPRTILETPPAMRYSISHPSGPPTGYANDPRSVTGRRGPLSQNTTPTTPHSAVGHFGPPSPAPGSTHLLQQPLTTLAQPPSGALIGDINRGRLPLEGGRLYHIEGGVRNIPPLSIETGEGRVPIPIDYDSGSLKAAEKRRKNSCASKRFRQRKKAGEMEQMQTLKRQEEQLKYITDERDFYRAERDFFRDLYARDMGMSRLPTRPQSPRIRQPPPQISESEGEQSWREQSERESSERHVRQRTSSGPTRMPLPPAAPAQPNPYGAGPPPHQGSHQSSWTTSSPPTSIPPEMRIAPPTPYAVTSLPPESSLPPLNPSREPHDRSWNPGP